MESPVCSFKNDTCWRHHDLVIHFALSSVSDTLENAKKEFLLTVTDPDGVREGTLPGYMKSAIKTLQKQLVPIIKIVLEDNIGSKILETTNVKRLQDKFEKIYRSVFGERDSNLRMNYLEGSLAEKMFVFSLKLWAISNVIKEYAEFKKDCNSAYLNSVNADIKKIYRYLLIQIDDDVEILKDGKYIPLKDVIK